ncbi:MAG: M13 family peptidase, partial [Bacteroidales bacterium]|nr:M13 family peptidase [Bacteroidales bacterium]
MKTKTLLVAALAVFTLASCAGDQQSSGIALENMDKSYAPGDNFYEYVNGNWVKSHPVPAEYSRYGVFEVLGEKVKDQIDLLIEEVTSTSHEQGTIEQKISDLYLLVMDSTARNQAGLAPLAPYLARINNVTNKQELVALMAEYGVKGISGLFRINLGTDRMDSKSYLVNASASGMSLRQKENYTDNDANTVAIREAFTKHMQNMFVMAGNDEKKAAEKVAAVWEIENKVANASLGIVEGRDPHATYHKMSYVDFKKSYPAINWDKVFEIYGLSEAKELNVSQPKAMKQVEEIIATTSLPKLKAYMEWSLLNSASSYLSDAMEAEHFDFFTRVMTGTEEM